MGKTFEKITIVSATTQAKIAPERGGLLASFSVANKEILYLDRETFSDPTKNVRGGIPLLFPNAGPLKGGLYKLPQHGFVRKMPWKVTGQNRNSITLKLLSNIETRINYPFDFALKLDVEVAENRLTHSLTVENTGEKPMPTAYGTHPYFNISQDNKHKLITNIGGFHPQEINWLEEFDQPFSNPGLITVQMPGKEIQIESDPAIFKFVRIWHQAGKDFICIEPWTRDAFALDNHDQSLWIRPAETLTFSLTISAKITE
jgi:galactose mutarotase-like enzyme